MLTEEPIFFVTIIGAVSLYPKDRPLYLYINPPVSHIDAHCTLLSSCMQLLIFNYSTNSLSRLSDTGPAQI
jgi:hypothetical protein